MICDTMLGSLFQLHDIDGVIVGADRIVANGDTANKVSLTFAHMGLELRSVDWYISSCSTRTTP
jgi:methylthioribose-1-phosphate isomerase